MRLKRAKEKLISVYNYFLNNKNYAYNEKIEFFTQDLKRISQSRKVYSQVRFVNNDGQEIFTFGKHKGALVDEVLDKEPGYFGWIQNAEFPLYTKKVLTGIKLRKLNTK